MKVSVLSLIFAMSTLAVHAGGYTHLTLETTDNEHTDEDTGNIWNGYGKTL